MLQDTAARLVDFFKSYKEHFTELEAFLVTKQEKVIGDDLVWLSESLVEEQRLVMRGNSIEAKRLLMFEELGLKDCRSADLLEQLPEDYKGQFRVCITSIEKSIDFIQKTNSDILDLIERKLDVQAEKLNQSIISGSDTYTATGSKVHKTISSMEDDFLGKV